MSQAPPVASSMQQGGTIETGWRPQEAYAIPHRLLAYTYAGGAIMPIASGDLGLVDDDGCLAEWTDERGATWQYWRGSRCAAAQTSAPPPEIR